MPFFIKQTKNLDSNIGAIIKRLRPDFRPGFMRAVCCHFLESLGYYRVVLTRDGKIQFLVLYNCIIHCIIHCIIQNRI